MEDEYQDDFENFSDDEGQHQNQIPQPRTPPKPHTYTHLNASLTEFNQNPAQIKNFVKTTTICSRPVDRNRDDEPSISTNSTNNTSKLESTPIKLNFSELRSRPYKPPQSLKATHKSDYQRFDINNMIRLAGTVHQLVPSLNNSFQSHQIVKERALTGSLRPAVQDNRRISVTSQKKIDHKFSPRLLDLTQELQSTKNNQYRPYKPQQQNTGSNRNSQKIYNKQTSQKSVGPVLQMTSEPNISAKCWVTMDAVNGFFYGGKNETIQREVASITKIMTCWVSIQLCRKFKIHIDDTFFEVSYNAQSVGGTSAGLSEGDQISIRDLLYGLMLPSGNDAAVTLAENLSEWQDEQQTPEDIEALAEFRRSKKQNYPTDYFLSQMNLWAKRFNMVNTYYANPHGLMNERNKSTATDIANLCFSVLKDALMQKIVSTKIYFSEIIDDEGYSKEIFWENTNKLLYKGFIGVKTGITNKAGPCVVEQYRDDKHHLLIVLLCCKSTDERWVDAAKIVDWVKSRQQG